MGAQNQSNLNKLDYCMSFGTPTQALTRGQTGKSNVESACGNHAALICLKVHYTGKKDINWVETFVVYKQI